MASADRVTRLLLSSPLTWLALATVIGLEAAFFVWFQPPLIMLGAASEVYLVTNAPDDELDRLDGWTVIRP